MVGDSTTSDRRQVYSAFIAQLEKLRRGELLNVTLILDDPAGNSYIQARAGCVNYTLNVLTM